MEEADQLGTTEPSNRLNKVVGGSLYLVGTPRLILTPVVPAQGSDAETNGVEWDARVSVWWDNSPWEDLR